MGAKIIKKLSIGKPPRFFLSLESPKQSAHQACLRNSIIHTSEAEMHRALPPPFFEIKKCVYRYDFIVTARRGNNIFAILSSPRGAGTIFLPFYRHRSARKQYLCRFIVTARRGSNTFAVLSSPRGAGAISPDPPILMFARAPPCCFKLLCMLSFLCALYRNDR